MHDSIQEGIDKFYRKMETTRKDQYVSEADFSDAIVTLNAMDEIFSKNPLYNENDTGDEGNYVSKYIFNPYLMDKEGNFTYLLSPGGLIKMGVVISMIISARLDKYYDENRGVLRNRALFVDLGAITLSYIQHILLSLFMTLAVILSIVFYVIQYIMCIFEYFIVTSVGALFIPFCLFDGTKSFTAKLVTLFSAYLIKLLVMTFCLYWVFNVFIDVGTTIMIDKNPASMLNFTYFIFTTLLCWTVTQNGPAIAVSLLNGSPQLSMGEFLHAAGTMAAGAMLARRTAHTVATVAQGAGHAAQGGVRAIQTSSAMIGGTMDAIKSAGLSGSAARNAFSGAMGSMLLNGSKERINEMLTGTKGKLTDENGESIIARVGAGSNSKNSNANGTQSMPDATEAAKTSAQKYIQGQNANKNAPNKPEPDDPRSGPAERNINEGKVNRG
jgi:type IV secretion system protein TrbL